MPKKKDKIPENFRTIYIITNADKTILSAFSSEEEAKKEIDFKYSILPEKFNIQPCCLNIDKSFAEEIKNVTDEDVILDDLPATLQRVNGKWKVTNPVVTEDGIELK